ncbi:uncharacterized protein LOC115632326 [Scaptodrosophila lebanonensis]|uniref:Uncharacterized protein LOC115632326 n=1 Tax=Drosophila lebanonensis TaxID=7225 RepID=A0A6J2UB86_DROLE|nr:uncharacterized protein LOC115632326 [Scaptodrosophila lebanonensis]
MSGGSGTDFDVHLIDMVRANPALWVRDLRSTPYDHTKKKKTELWRSIATSLKADVNTCITRWKHLHEKLLRELQKEQAGGVGSDWTLLPKMRFVEQHQKHHNTERQQQSHPSSPMQNVSESWRSLNPEQLIEEVHDEDDPLQEAMDEQRDLEANAAPIVVQEAAVTAVPIISTPHVSAELLKRIESLLEGLGATNRIKAEKRIVAYLCKCNLRALNDEQIDDIFI